jgi:rhodanese-related sulfurtransferase
MGSFFSMIKSILGPSDPSANLAPQAAQLRLKGNPSPQLVDVRTEEENREGLIKGSKNIPLHELEGRLGEIPKDRPVLLYCRSGARSGAALSILKSRGYTEVAHISGGMMAWGGQGLPIDV